MARTFARLDSVELQHAFQSWTRTISHLTQNEIVALECKQVRRLHDQALGQEVIQMVSAWACGKTKLYEAERV